ncbi:MAG: hypothetical protein ACRDZQ_06400 [Acidimicrobiales bacterium]
MLVYGAEVGLASLLRKGAPVVVDGTVMTDASGVAAGGVPGASHHVASRRIAEVGAA